MAKVESQNPACSSARRRTTSAYRPTWLTPPAEARRPGRTTPSPIRRKADRTSNRREWVTLPIGVPNDWVERTQSVVGLRRILASSGGISSHRITVTGYQSTPYRHSPIMRPLEGPDWHRSCPLLTVSNGHSGRCSNGPAGTMLPVRRPNKAKTPSVSCGDSTLDQP